MRPFRLGSLLALAACASPPAEAPVGCRCDAIGLPADPVTTEAGVAELLESVRSAAFPELEGVAIGVGAVEGLAYFRAWTELDTVGLDDGRARTYTVQYDPIVLSDPMSPAALAALLVHEVGHVEDYVAQDTDALVAFAVWYASEDPLTSASLAEYERGTDEKALDRGCAAGLADARRWIWSRATDEVPAEKQHNYWSAEEIEAWAEANSTCPGS